MNSWAQCGIDSNDNGAEIQAPYDSSSFFGFLYIDDECFTGTGQLPVTRIGNDAFENCIGLSGISFPPSLTSIGSKSFYRCEQLAQVEFRGNCKLKKIEGYAFAYIGTASTRLATVILPPDVEFLDYCSFAFVRAKIIFCGRELKGDLFFNSPRKLEVVISSRYSGPLSSLGGDIQRSDVLCAYLGNESLEALCPKRKNSSKIQLVLSLFILI